MSRRASLRRPASPAAILAGMLSISPAAAAIMSSDMLSARAQAALGSVYGSGCASERMDGERLRFVLRCPAGQGSHLWIAQTSDGMTVELAPLDPSQPDRGPSLGAGFPPEPALVQRSAFGDAERAAILRALGR